MSSMQDLIRKKKQDIAAKKVANMKTLKPADGKHVYRILPSWRLAKGAEAPQPFWHDFGMHFIKSDPKSSKVEAVYLCVDKTFGRECDVCRAIGNAIRNTDSDAQRKVYQASNSSQKYLMNVLHRTANDKSKVNEVQVMEIGTSVFESICEIVETYGDITDLENGIDLIIVRKGSGLDTDYTVMPAPKSEPVDKSIMDKLIDLDALVAQESESKKNEALSKFAEVVGILPPVGGHAALPSSAASRLTDFDLAEDVDFDESKPEESLSDDELDALLGDYQVNG